MRGWSCARPRQAATAAEVHRGKFKRDAAALVIDTGRPIAQVARELGVYESSLGHWVAQARADRSERGDPLAAGERARLKQLEREVAELRMGNEILLKRSVAFWVKETSTR